MTATVLRSRGTKVAVGVEFDDDISDETENPPEDGCESSTSDGEEMNPTVVQGKRPMRWSRLLAFAVLPALALLLAVAAGYLKWLGSSDSHQVIDRIDSVRAATDATVAMLSYKPDTVQNDLDAAKDRLTGSFRDSYSSLTDDVVAPAAIQKLITAKATVAASASVTTTPRHAVVLVFVDQTITIGNGSPANTASSVRVTLEKVDDRWLISQFEPV
jgi:Mce-associated membrane protein